jgi:hypothetical protein
VATEVILELVLMHMVHEQDDRYPTSERDWREEWDPVLAVENTVDLAPVGPEPS